MQNYISRFLSTKTTTNPAKTLYKYLLRQCKLLPKGPQEHYKFQIKQSFKQYLNETNPERVEEIIQRSYEDAEWVLKKYKIKTDDLQA